MAEAAARREARRRRILENSENRLQKITGKYEENSTEVKSNNDIKYSRPQPENGYIENKYNTITENKMISKETDESTFEQDNCDAESFQLPNSNLEYRQLDDHFTSNHLNSGYLPKEDRTKCDILNSYSKVNSPNQTLCEQSESSFLSNIIFSPMSYIFLAAFVNILFVTNVNFSFLKGIITPFLVISITQLCLGKESEESQGNSMLVAALILCNIRPTVVHNFNKIWTICRTISKNFALYLTSFVLFNWIISICWSDLNHVQFH